MADPLEVAICALKTIAFQNYSIPRELAEKALSRINELRSKELQELANNPQPIKEN